METKDTAVALLKEWKKAKNDSDLHRHAKSFFGKSLEELQWKNVTSQDMCETILEDVSRRLNEKAEAAGISIINGRFVQNYALLNVDHTPHGSTCWLDLPAREQPAIQEWLLIKNEEKTA